MNKKAIWTIIIIIVILLGLVWLLGMGQDGDVEGAEISIEDQAPGNMITVEEATLTEPGFIVVRTPEGTVVGQSDLRQPGTYSNVIIILNAPAEAGEEFEVVLVEDTDGDGAFNAEADAEAESAFGGVVLEGFMIVSDEDETATTTDETATTTDDGSAVGGDASIDADAGADTDVDSGADTGGSLY